MSRVLPADVVGWLIGFTRAELRAYQGRFPVAAGAVVRAKEPEPGEEFPDRLVVIDEATRVAGELIVDEVDIGVSVLAGTREHPQDARDLARLVHAIIRDSAGTQPGNPIAAVLASNGPYPVPEDAPRARRYSTHTLSTVGDPI